MYPGVYDVWVNAPTLLPGMQSQIVASGLDLSSPTTDLRLNLEAVFFAGTVTENGSATKGPCTGTLHVGDEVRDVRLPIACGSDGLRFAAAAPPGTSSVSLDLIGPLLRGHFLLSRALEFR